MNDVAVNQAYLFGIFVLNGILIGVIFDVFRILRKSFSTPNIITYLEDIAFWIISALTVIYTLFVFNNGEIRAFIFIGIFTGAVLYMLFISKPFVRVSVNVILFIKKIVCSILKVVISPIKFIFKVIYNILSVPIRHFSKDFSNFKGKLTKFKSKSQKKSENKEGF